MNKLDAYGGTCKNPHDELFGVGNEAVEPRPGKPHALCERFAWALSQGRMLHLVVDLVGPLCKDGREIRKGPHGVFMGIDLTSEQAHVLGCLGIAAQLVEQLGRGRAKQALNQRPRARLLGWSLMLGDKVARQHRLKGHAPKIGPPIDDNCLRQPLMPLHAQPKHHHRRAVARRVIGQVGRQDPPAVGIGQQRQPGTPEGFARKLRYQQDVQLGMIKMGQRKGSFAVARCQAVQVKEERPLGVGGAAPRACGNHSGGRQPRAYPVEGTLADWGQTLTSARLTIQQVDLRGALGLGRCIVFLQHCFEQLQ